jgi:hypothetical protein
MVEEGAEEWFIMSRMGTRVWLYSSVGAGRPSGMETVRVFTGGQSAGGLN